MKVISFFIVVFLFFNSCKTKNTGKEIINLDSLDIEEEQQAIFKLDTIGEGLPIFYNMYLSVELSTLFETSGTVFELSVLNSTDKVSEYIASYKQAMNIGVYAVDLSYTRAFEQMEIAGWYLKSMQQLSEELGIPNDYFYNTIQRLEKNINDKDSIIKIANEVYVKTDEYLKDNERYATAAFIILGGWVEAIHIAIHIAEESKDINIIERIAEQKYSLNHLILMLSDYNENEVMADYIRKLEIIKTEFDEFNVIIDPELIKDSRYYDNEVKNYLTHIEKIKKPVNKIRNDIIN